MEERTTRWQVANEQEIMVIADAVEYLIDELCLTEKLRDWHGDTKGVEWKYEDRKGNTLTYILHRDDTHGCLYVDIDLKCPDSKKVMFNLNYKIAEIFGMSIPLEDQ